MRRHWKRFKLGDERTREFFAWWPVTIRQEHAAETRWLETVRVLERWTEFKAGEKFWPRRFCDESNSNAGERTPPTLTDEEREAIAWCVEMAMNSATDCVDEIRTLRGLLDRL